VFKEEQYLPYSNARYTVNQYGNVFESYGTQLQTYEIDNRVYVDIDWIEGKKAYPVALLVLASFDMLYMFPSHLYSKVELMFKDGIEKNLSPSNLVYRFKDGPIEVEGYPGFYYIPFYTGYAININGDLININRGKILTWYSQKSNGINNRKGGYLYHTKVKNGKTSILLKHRAMCFVFKIYNSNVKEITVNHRDCDPTNNKLDNLEWSTYSENNIHAIENGLRASRSRAVLMRNLKTGEIKRYPTITQCSRDIGQPHTGLVRHRLDSEHSINRVYPDFLQFKYDDGVAWPEIDLNKVKITYSTDSTDIIARNVFTGECIIFTGAQNGKKSTGVEPSQISRHLRDNCQIPIIGWNFQYLKCLGPWPNHTHRHLQIYEKHPLHPRNGLILTKIDTGEEMFFTSVREGSEALGIDMRNLQVAASKGGKYGKYILKTFKLEENLGQPIE